MSWIRYKDLFFSGLWPLCYLCSTQPILNKLFPYLCGTNYTSSSLLFACYRRISLIFLASSGCRNYTFYYICLGLHVSLLCLIISLFSLNVLFNSLFLYFRDCPSKPLLCGLHVLRGLEL